MFPIIWENCEQKLRMFSLKAIHYVQTSTRYSECWLLQVPRSQFRHRLISNRIIVCIQRPISSRRSLFYLEFQYESTDTCLNESSFFSLKNLHQNAKWSHWQPQTLIWSTVNWWKSHPNYFASVGLAKVIHLSDPWCLSTFWKKLPSFELQMRTLHAERLSRISKDTLQRWILFHAAKTFLAMRKNI